jgi:hypothetical protein
MTLHVIAEEPPRDGKSKNFVFNPRKTQTEENTDIEEARNFTETFLKSMDIAFRSVDGWRDIINKTLRYETADTYLRYSISWETSPYLLC